MNTPLDNGHENLRHAEYVLGVLDADARAAVEREVENDPQSAAAVAWWQQRLTPLSEDLAQSVPPGYVWPRIQAALGHPASLTTTTMTRPAPHEGLWNNLALWRWLGIGGGLLASACVVLLMINRPAPQPPPAMTASYMVARIQQDNGVAAWTATMDLQHARMVVVPAAPVGVASDRSTELWLIPAGRKPISLGLIAGDHATTVSLAPDVLAQLASTSLLAVSVEPQGGSPTGQPTGPVVAKGSVGTAPTGTAPAVQG